jgi:hypothetical protein
MAAFSIESPAQRLCRSWVGFKSVCTCGHTGDGTGSEHFNEEQHGNGHGACRICGCQQFTWRRWTPSFGEVLAKVVHTYRKAVLRGN